MAEAVHIGEFVIESVLGEGGMGRVYRARQVALDRWVALKVLSGAQSNRNFVDRFLREARSAARLVHPNIIQVYSVGDQGGIPYFTMEYVEGEDIEHLLRPGAGDPFSMDEVIEIIRSVTKALGLASEHGIVHRDIKPANVMVTKTGLVKVMDFGLAKGAVADTDHALTQQGLIVGTPAYMSPEQGASKVLDFRADQYSLGCVMYECITGQPPFKADNVASLIFKHMYEPTEAINTLRADCNPEIDAVCMKMLAKKPEDRYTTPSDLLEALAKVPCNSNLAEITLAKRVTKLLQTRKRKAAPVITKESVISAPTQAKDVVKPSAPTVVTPPPVANSQSIDTTAPTLPPTRTPHPESPVPLPRPVISEAPAGFLKAKPAAAATPASPATPSAPVPAAPARSFITQKRPAMASQQQEGQVAAATPMPAPPPSGLLSPVPKPMMTPLPIPRPAGSGGTPVPASLSGRTPIPGSGSRLGMAAAKVHEIFQKLPDGRWSYRLDQGRCTFAEGLAHDVPVSSLAIPEGLGDCVLCSNWNKRTGCAVAFNQELESQNRYRGLKLYTEQAITWSGAGRFDKAIVLLDNYVKANPDDPEGYRELARIYDRPEYREKDKRRAIVLYARFAELAKQRGGFTQVEISRAEERMASLKAANHESRSSGLQSGVGIPFQCFYRGGIICFAYGVISQERILIARAGEMDPDSGIQASEMGGAVTKATSIFRRFMSESAKKEQQAQVKKELQRLAALPPETLVTDSAKVLALPMEQITGVAMSIDNAVNIRNVKINTPQQNHELLFTESGSFRADQCYALIRRKLSKK
jgi:serine/threonine protein kinase